MYPSVSICKDDDIVPSGISVCAEDRNPNEDIWADEDIMLLGKELRNEPVTALIEFTSVCIDDVNVFSPATSELTDAVMYPKAVICADEDSIPALIPVRYDPEADVRLSTLISIDPVKVLSPSMSVVAEDVTNPSDSICNDDDTVPELTVPKPNAVIWAEEETIPGGLLVISW